MSKVTWSASPVHLQFTDPAESRPTIDDVPAPLSAADAAWLLGHSLGRISEASEPPAGYSADEAAAFRAGWAFGKASPDTFDDCPRDPAWYASADELPSWTDEVRATISEADARLVAEENGANHDAQGDPNAIELWAQTPDDYWGSLAEFEDQQGPYDAMSEAELCEAVGSVAARSHAAQG